MLATQAGGAGFRDTLLSRSAVTSSIPAKDSSLREGRTQRENSQGKSDSPAGSLCSKHIQVVASKDFLPPEMFQGGPQNHPELA